MDKKPLSERFNDWRVFSRGCCVLLGVLVHDSSTWFMSLSDPTAEQSAYAIGMVTAAVGFFKFYVDSRKTQNESA